MHGMSIILHVAAATALALLATNPAWAYIGPGAGLSLLAAFWALLMAVVSAIGFLMFWPLRRRLRRGKRSTATANGPPADGGQSARP